MRAEFEHEPDALELRERDNREPTIFADPAFLGLSKPGDLGASQQGATLFFSGYSGLR